MTKEQKSRRKRSVADFDDREDDFILADLDSMLHDVEPAPVPLNHILDDEDVIDRLLVIILLIYWFEDEFFLAIAC